MGFYGNIKDIEKNSSFVFDKIYANRKQMDSNASIDNIYTGRYVLIEYDTEASSLDYKKVYKDTNTKRIQGYDVLYLSEDYGQRTVIMFDDVNSSFSGDLLRGITAGTIVYINKKDINEYYECVGYFILDESGNCTLSTQKDNSTFSQSDLLDIYEPSVKYALFSTIVDSSLTPNSNYAANYNIDIQYAKEKGITISGHGWDSTVWQKTIVGGIDKYVMVAELNTVVPTFGLSAEAPTQMPLKPHFDSTSTDVYYNLHWQPNWGMRTQLANAALSDGEKITEPGTGAILSDSNTTWIRKIYDEETDRIKLFYYTNSGQWKRFTNISEIGAEGILPAAVYYNKKGFDSAVRYHSSLDNRVGMDITGYSQSLNDEGEWENTQYITHQPGVTESAVDTQELSLVLPAIGNAVSEMWDIVYGNGDGEEDSLSNRKTDISWRDTPVLGVDNRLQLIATEDNKTYHYNVADVETLAGAINSTHDLMGMIIEEVEDIPDDLENFANNRASLDSIYYIDGKFYRKSPLNSFTELTDGEYTYIVAEDIHKGNYNSNTYYEIVNEQFVPCEDEEFDTNKVYYIRTVPDEMKLVNNGTGKFKTFQETVGGNYLYKNANSDYVYAEDYAREREYYTIDKEKIEEVKLSSNYATNTYYYKRGKDYYLDKNVGIATDSQEYVISNVTPVTARKIYVPGRYYSLIIKNNEEFYQKDLGGYNSSIEKGDGYYILKKLTSLSEITDNITLVYKQRGKVQITVNKDGINRLVYKFIRTGENVAIEVWKETETIYHRISDDSVIDIFDEDGNIDGELLTYDRYDIESEDALYIPYRGDRTNILANASGYPIIYAYNPNGAMYQTENELYSLTKVSNLNAEITTSIYYKFIDDNYIQVVDNIDIPSYEDIDDNTLFYKATFYLFANDDGEPYNFYQPNQYYYQGKDKKSWFFDKNGSYNKERVYYRFLDGAAIKQDLNLSGVDLYIKGKYYYKKHNRFFVDNNDQPTEKETDGTDRLYYTGSDEYYVYSDTLNVLSMGMHWNTALPIPHSISLARKNETSYTMRELIGFARSLNTIHGLLLRINNFLEYGNETTRDTSTVQGVLNSLNDIIAKFEILDQGEVIVTDAYGRMHTASIETDKWLEAYVEPDVNEPKVCIHHLYNPVSDTSSSVDLNDSSDNNDLIIYEALPDETGHIVNTNTRTITLPFGIKTVNADTGSFTAETTQDSFDIMTGDLWLNTSIQNDVLVIKHDDAQSIVNTKGLLSNVSPQFGDSFVIPKVAIDQKGHVNTLEEHFLTLPKLSLIQGEDNVITSLALDPGSGTITENTEKAGNLVLLTYIEEDGEISANDTIASAIGKNAYKINILNSGEDVIGSLAHEAKLRADSDTDLQQHCDDRYNNLTNVITDMSNSFNTRLTILEEYDLDTRIKNLDSTLNTKIDNNKTTIEASITALQTTLQSNIDAVSNRVLALENLGLSTEIANLKAANTNLNEQIAVLEKRLAALENPST